jgi:hypothetical protein
MTETLTANSTAESGRKDSVDIEFLYWDECPSHERALEILQDVLNTEEVPATVSIRQVETDEDAEAMRFPGSPTIRVNGADIQPTAEEDVVGLTCRAYQTPAGKISPLPPRDLIVEALHEAVAETE